MHNQTVGAVWQVTNNLHAPAMLFDSSEAESSSLSAMPLVSALLTLIAAMRAELRVTELCVPGLHRG